MERTIASRVRSGETVFVPVGNRSYRVVVGRVGHYTSGQVRIVGAVTEWSLLAAIARGTVDADGVTVPQSTPVLKETP